MWVSSEREPYYCGVDIKALEFVAPKSARLARPENVPEFEDMKAPCSPSGPVGPGNWFLS